MFQKSWYIGLRQAEGESAFFVELTDYEKKIIDRFLGDQFNGFGERYSGSMELVEKPFKTREEAEEYAKKELVYVEEEEEE